MSEKNKKKGNKINKKSLIIVLSCVVIILVILTIYIKNISLNNDNNVNNNVNNNEHNNDNKYLSVKGEWNNSFYCSILNPTSLGSGETEIFGVNDDVYCSVKKFSKFYTLVETYKYNINYMEFEFEDNENIELVDVYSLKNNWDIKTYGNNIILDLKNDDTIDYKDSITDFYFKFHIKNNASVSDDYEIFFKKFMFASDGFYRMINGITLKLETAKTRNYNFDGTIMFDSLNENGSFDTINSYKCANEDCFMNWVVVQGFEYSNDNLDVKMIFDGDYKVLYNKKIGVINTYGKNALWLCDEEDNKNSVCENSGRYIYIQEKGSNKYGIIDADGNVIKNFVLESLPFVNFYEPYSLKDRYSIENNMLVSIKNGKYGIVEITSDKMVVDYLYDDIKLINNKYFKVKIGSKWYIYSFSSNNKVINEGFDDFDYISEDMIACINSKILYIKDINNNTITKIDTEFKDNTYYLYTEVMKDNIYQITIKNRESYPSVYSFYEYNSSNKSLSSSFTNDGLDN